jgi:predicted small secreted protein
MKKIFYAIVAVAAISFSACNGTAQGGEETDSINADSVVAEAPEANVDAIISSLSTAVADNDAEATQTFLQKAQAYIAKLQEEGKLEEAKVYIAKLQQFISENEEKITQLTAGNETLGNIVSAVKAIPVDVTNAAADAAESAKNAAADAAENAQNAATDAANNAVESGKKEAGKAIDNAASAAKNALGI